MIKINYDLPELNIKGFNVYTQKETASNETVPFQSCGKPDMTTFINNH